MIWVRVRVRQDPPAHQVRNPKGSQTLVQMRTCSGAGCLAQVETTALLRCGPKSAPAHRQKGQQQLRCLGLLLLESLR